MSVPLHAGIHTPLGDQRQTTPGQTPSRQTSPWADNPWADTPRQTAPGRHPLGRHPLGRQLLDRHPPPWADTPQADIPLGRQPLGRHPQADVPLGRHLPGQTPPGRCPWPDTPRQTPPGRHPTRQTSPWADTSRETPLGRCPQADFPLLDTKYGQDMVSNAYLFVTIYFVCVGTMDSDNVTEEQRNWSHFSETNRGGSTIHYRRGHHRFRGANISLCQIFNQKSA